MPIDGAMNDQLKKNIRDKVSTYIKRAEEIKGHSKDRDDHKKVTADGGSSKDKKDDDDGDDPDKKRMMRRFEG